MENYKVNTDFWFPKILTARITKMLRGKLPQIVQDITIHDDGDKSMVGITFGPDVGDIAATAVKREILYYIIGFVDAHDSLESGTLPQLVQGFEARSGNRVDQTNFVTTTGQIMGGKYTWLGGVKTAKACNEAIGLAYNAINQFCKLNGLHFPTPEL